VKPAEEHRQLCTIELIAEGHASRCPGEECAFWDRGCALARVEGELDGRPEVAQLLVNLRRELDRGARSRSRRFTRFAHLLNEDKRSPSVGSGGVGVKTIAAPAADTASITSASRFDPPG
jgi:hypothetical protein